MGSDEPSSFDPRGALVAIPFELRALPRWVCWRLEPDPDGGKPKKIPVNPRTAGKAMSNAASTWATFDDATAALESHSEWAGLMLALVADDDLVAIDLDGCLDASGAFSPAARDLVETFETYTEVSPSGTGLHLLLRGRKPEGSRCKSKRLEGIAQIEIYEHKRFIAMTGRRVAGTPETPQERQIELDDRCAELWPPRPERAARPVSGQGVAGDDRALLDKARNARNGEKFRRLYDDGDLSRYGDDESSADLALCNMLAFYTGSEPERIDRLFRGSALYRDKWEREEYRRMTIDRALVGKGEFFGDDTPSRIGSDGKPLPIVQDGTDEYRVADEIVVHLANEPDLYVRGGKLVQIVEIDGRPIIAEVSEPTLRARITRCVSLQRQGRGGKSTMARPHREVVRALHARHEWPGIRALSGIVHAPVLRPNGSILAAPGYDDVTRTVWTHGAAQTFPRVPERISASEANEAARSLLEPLEEFPFETAADRSAMLAGLLTVVGRSAFDGPAPLFLIDANAPGVGKSLLAQYVAEIALGRPIAASAYSPNPRELQKLITSIAIAGDAMVLFDNLAGEIGNDALDRAVTALEWQDRRVHTNSTVVLPLRATWFATGNNTDIVGDMPRRVLPIRLKSVLDRPEERGGFRIDNFIQHVRDRQCELYIAAITILAGYMRAGRPPQLLERFGSFETWSELVRASLVWAGLPDPVQTRRRLASGASSRQDGLRTLLHALIAHMPDGRPFLVADLLKSLYADPGSRLEGASADELRAALEAVTGASPAEPPDPRRVGTLFRGARDRWIDGLALVHTDGPRQSSGTHWVVQRRATT